ncbi:CvpA family protein [Acuticoccus sediminis]|uniref:CvpA family protein n=1 Tax=Acuticoccus sediminis TaxID=2184697 RepID=UPI001CFE49B3|nr:CvpA family protein [Acuticoccus sediminis]
MNIAILDGVVIAVVFISAVLAMFRGFVREVLSIAAWVAAAILAYMFYEQALPYVSQYVDNQTIAIGLSAAGIFLVSLIVVSLITMKISDFVMDSPVGPVDRLVGFVFGAARGLLLVVVAVIFFNWLVAAPERPAWVTTAASYPRLSELGDRLLAAIPDDPERAIRGAFEDGAGSSTPPAGSQPTIGTPGAVPGTPGAVPATPGTTSGTGTTSNQPSPQQEPATPGAPTTGGTSGTDDNTVIQPQPLGGNTSAN